MGNRPTRDPGREVGLIRDGLTKIEDKVTWTFRIIRPKLNINLTSKESLL